MDVILKQEEDSEVEILQPEVLQDHYREQQLRLITALSKCNVQIPKKWEDFEIFVKNMLKFQLSADLVRSVWGQLCAAEQMTNDALAGDTVEISDEEEDLRQIVKSAKKNSTEEQITTTVKVINGKAEPGHIVQQSCGEPLVDTVEISDEELGDPDLWSPDHVKGELMLSDNSLKSNDEEVSKLSLEQSYCLPNVRKRNRNGVKRSLPCSMDEQEAEALRERLLLDKLIELELRQIINGFVKNKMKNSIKRRKKNSIKKNVFNGLLFGGNSSQEIP